MLDAFRAVALHDRDLVPIPLGRGADFAPQEIGAALEKIEHFLFSGEYTQCTREARGQAGRLLAARTKLSVTPGGLVDAVRRELTSAAFERGASPAASTALAWFGEGCAGKRPADRRA
jgi:hypothetical protein